MRAVFLLLINYCMTYNHVAEVGIFTKQHNPITTSREFIRVTIPFNVSKHLTQSVKLKEYINDVIGNFKIYTRYARENWTGTAFAGLDAMNRSAECASSVLNRRSTDTV